MNALLEAALIAAGAALVGVGAGSWVTYKLGQMAGRATLIHRTRRRLAHMYAPLENLIFTYQDIVKDQSFVWGNDTIEKKRERQRLVLRERSRALNKVAGYLALEPKHETLAKLARDLLTAFELHMFHLESTALPYSREDEMQAVARIDDLVAQLDTLLKAKIADLDAQSGRLVNLSTLDRSRWWLGLQRGQKRLINKSGESTKHSE